MTTSHAPSQITETDTVRLLQAALHDHRCQGTMRLVRGRAIGTQEMLGRWTIDTPEGPIHRVAIVRVLDSEPMGFDETYRDEQDAIDVWEHLSETFDEAQASHRKSPN